jgi:hypothetical protein
MNIEELNQASIEADRARRKIELSQKFNAILSIAKPQKTPEQIKFIESTIKDEIDNDNPVVGMVILHLFTDYEIKKNTKKYANNINHLEQTLKTLYNSIDDAGGLSQYLKGNKDKIFTHEFFDDPKINCPPVGVMNGYVFSNQKDVKADLQYINNLINKVIELENKQCEIIHYTDKMLNDLKSLQSEAIVSFTSINAVKNGEKINFLKSRHDAISLFFHWKIDNKKNKTICDNCLFKGKEITNRNVTNDRYNHGSTRNDIFIEKYLKKI